MSAKESSDCCLDCDAGRRLGCGTFCCQLLVRLTPKEARQIYPDQPEHRFLEKDEDGFCRFLDRDSYGCKIWEKRPGICRGYDCNSEFMLQVAIAENLHALVPLLKRAQLAYIPRHLWATVPQTGAIENKK